MNTYRLIQYEGYKDFKYLQLLIRGFGDDAKGAVNIFNRGEAGDFFSIISASSRISPTERRLRKEDLQRKIIQKMNIVYLDNKLLVVSNLDKEYLNRFLTNHNAEIVNYSIPEQVDNPPPKVIKPQGVEEIVQSFLGDKTNGPLRERLLQIARDNLKSKL